MLFEKLLGVFGMRPIGCGRWWITRQRCSVSRSEKRFDARQERTLGYCDSAGRPDEYAGRPDDEPQEGFGYEEEG